MEPLTIDEVVTLINRTGHTKIEKSDDTKSQSSWTRFDGRVESGGVVFYFDLIYIPSQSTADTFRDIAKTVARKKAIQSQIVYAPSLEAKYPAQISSLKQKSEKTLSLSDFFSAYVRQQTDIYIERITSALVHPYYVDPKVEVPASVSIKTPNPVLSFFTDPAADHPPGPGALAVLLAEPGQGKTYMTRYLAVKLAQKNFIPIYVNSEQWSKMQIGDLSSLWKTIANSFRYFAAPINWIEGAEEQFLKAALKAGLFRIIFDGLDEYVLWNQGNSDTNEVIETLSRLTEETGARILVTSRTSFWESEARSESGESESQATLYKIQPFDLNTARNYFSNRFQSNSKKLEAASVLFEKIAESVAGSRTANFVGRGFFLSLLADLIERSDTVSPPRDQGEVVRWIMLKLCEREQERQQLPLTAEQQLQILKEFAFLVASGEPATSEVLKLVIQTSSDLDDAQAAELVGQAAGNPGRLNDHPLINRAKNRDQWIFVQDWIQYILLAEHLLTLVEGNRNKELYTLCNSATFSKFQIEVNVQV